ncbi:hypothetical protein [Streptomyces iranensis]|uniref:Uncharacterized protein n=1 Tax=Streptomyces iranensis TaxID=576784 RepID=A0ABS4N9J8_9ACTN|nr:hypothetical protein [Streptomyces iranensis]
MPMIRLTVPAGALTEEARTTVRRDLASVLLRWEGAPDTAFFRAQSWSYLVELPDGAQTTAEDDAPRFLVEVTVPQRPRATPARRRHRPHRGLPGTLNHLARCTSLPSTAASPDGASSASPTKDHPATATVASAPCSSTNCWAGHAPPPANRA